MYLTQWRRMMWSDATHLWNLEANLTLVKWVFELSSRAMIIYIIAVALRKEFSFELYLFAMYELFSMYQMVIWITRDESKKIQPCAKFAARGRRPGRQSHRLNFFTSCHVIHTTFHYNNYENCNLSFLNTFQLMKFAEISWNMRRSRGRQPPGKRKINKLLATFFSITTITAITTTPDGTHVVAVIYFRIFVW